MYRSLNPATEELVQEYPAHPWDSVSHAAMKARDTFELWRQAPFGHRAERVRALADRLVNNKSDLAFLMTREMGKPIAQAEAEIEKCAWGCAFFAEHGEAFLRGQTVATDAAESFVRFDPLGVILGIMPWNFPFWQAFRFAIPTLLAGNVILLKHAPNVPGCALKIRDLFEQAGFPDGVYENLFLSNENAERLIGSGWVEGVSLTGSSRAGRAVAAAAGQALVRPVLELGGSDAFIILEDADLDRAVAGAIRSRMQNNGQSCIAAKRFIVAEAVFPEFMKRVKEAVAKLKTGDPTDRTVDIGPLARRDLRDQLADQVQRALGQGAQRVCGGTIPMRKGFFFEPTLLQGPGGKSVCFNEELFGPVLFALPFSDEDEAVELANATPYGLGSSIWTRAPQKAREFIPHLDAGSVFVNEVVKSDPRLPFGGVKQSGYGRELSEFGMREFVNVKTVYVGK